MKAAIDPERVSRALDRRRQIMRRLRQAVALQHAAAVEVQRLADVALDAGVTVETVVAAVDEGAVHVFLARTAGESELEAARRAIRVVRGRVVAVVKRKLRDGRDCSTQGRAGPGGDLGEPVWRVEIERGAR